METIAGKCYYSKDDICARFGMAKDTLNRRILVTGVECYKFGRFKYYDEEQVQILMECRRKVKKQED